MKEGEENPFLFSALLFHTVFTMKKNTKNDAVK